MLSVKNLSVSIEEKSILQNISIEFLPGSTTALLGPNGSGKSTLGNALLGAPFLTLTEGQILFDQEDVTEAETALRSQKGMMLTFQSPLPLAGVSAMDLFRAALVKKYSAKELHSLAHQYAEELDLPKEFLKRSLYEGFSGGERKKMEVLQVALFQPRVVIFDEIDTGVDVDALKTITKFLDKHLPTDTTRIFITHSHKLLTRIHPDQVVVLKQGRIVKTGDKKLADFIEANGFESFTSEEFTDKLA
jgi:Fe-S cluster assembly ATP-binding protein